MVNIYVYAPDETDFDSFGVVGALVPTSAVVTLIAGQPAELVMAHPYDEWNKYTALQCGVIIKCPMPVRTCPEIAGGAYVTTVETWTVKATASKTERGVYSKASGGKRKTRLKAGQAVTVVQKPATGERWKIKTGKASGWMASEALNYETIEQLPGTPGAIEQAAPAWSARDQLFRVYNNPLENGNNQTVTVRARQIFADLAGNLTSWSNNGVVAMCDTTDNNGDNVPGVLSSIFDGAAVEHDFTAYTDIADTRVGFPYQDRNILDVLLNDTDGVVPLFGAELVVDDYELYFLHNAGIDRNMRIAYGDNLLGVTWETSYDDLVTAVRPYGFKKNGERMYLTDDGSGDIIYSPHYGDYDAPYIVSLECKGCQLGESGVTKALARERMREQAQALFDDAADLPAMTVDVDFVNLGDTEEYAGYRNLETAYLYAPVKVEHPLYGPYELRVNEIEYDALAKGQGEVTHMTLGIPSATLAALTQAHLSSLRGQIHQTVEEVRALDLRLYPEYAIVHADANGENRDYAGAYTRVAVLYGAYDVTDESEIVAMLGDGVTGDWDEGGMFRVSQITGERGLVTFTASTAGRSVSRNLGIEVVRAGMDGDSTEYIYRRTADNEAPGMTYSVDDAGYQSPEYLPAPRTGAGCWTDDPQGVSNEWRYEWVSVRERSDGEWGEFTQPVLWAKYGMDGASIEYIYRRTIDNNTPSMTYTTGETGYQSPEYLPAPRTGAGCWTDDPQGVDSTYRYEWVAQRTRVAELWGPFSAPALWAKYADDGTPGSDGTPGQDGEDAKTAYLSPATLGYVANASGQCPASSQYVYAYAHDGISAVTPTVGAISGAPSGMTVSAAAVSGNRVRITVTVSSGATLGGAGYRQGQIAIPITYPVNTTLYLVWGKICNGYDGSDGSVTFWQSSTPTANQVGDLWVDSGNGNAIKRWNGSSWVVLLFQADAIIAGQIGAALIDVTNLYVKYIRDLDRAASLTVGVGGGLGPVDRGLVFNDSAVSNDEKGAIGIQAAAGSNSGGFGIYGTPGVLISGYPIVDVSAGTDAMERGGFSIGAAHPVSGNATGIVFRCALYPNAGNAHTLGGDGSGQRWKKAYFNSAVDVSSDERQKKDIDRLAAVALLRKLLPKRYRLIEDDSKLHFGFIAQQVRKALAGSDYEDAGFFNDENPNELSLCYEELIAVLVEGWQEHEQRINDLEARVAALEGR